MAAWNDFWAGLSRGARAGLVAGIVVIVGAVSLLGWSLMRTDYGVLFGDLNERDMAAMVAELDKQKVPYRVDEQGRALLVPKDQVHKVRIKLMGTPVALHGAVGFEVFNNSDLAMTDFAQKVNYQRALQGELTRTIQSLDEIQSARVHLALPEQGLFRKTSAKAKASVTVHLKAGRTLAGEQVTGIQRLVAASVSDITTEDVAVLDQHGVVLSRSGPGAEPMATGLDQKQGAEAYLAKKARAVVDKLYGAGESLVTVDAEFGHEQTRVTTEEVLAAKHGNDGPAAGVIVRERVTTRDGGGAAGAERSGTSMQETDYQTGKRTEQVVSPAGQLKRLNVAVVVRRPVDAAEIDKLRALVAAAVGLDVRRGDVIAVHSMAAVVAAPVAGPIASAAEPDDPAPERSASVRTPVRAESDSSVVPIIGVLLAAAALIGGAVALSRRRLQATADHKALNDSQRAEVLTQVRSWLEQEPASAARAATGRVR